MLEEDESIFWSEEFTIPVTLRSSCKPNRVNTRGIDENAVTEENLGGRASRHSLQPQITVPLLDAKPFEEGDFIDCKGQSFEIVDIVSDDIQATLLLREL